MARQKSAVAGLGMNQSFWKDKKIFITGHTGFKGAWLSMLLQSLGADLVGYSLPSPTNPSLFNICSLKEKMVHIESDLRDLDALSGAIKTHQPEIIIHLAAQSLVRLSYEDPIETYSTNVMGSLNLLEAARQAGSAKAIVMVTTDKCYENKEWDWGYRENEPMGGFDPYSSSKGCCELMIASFRRSFFSPEKYNEHQTAIASARAGNVIGGGDWALDRLIPDIFRALMAKEEILIRSPHAIRPWQHVLESLTGYLLLAEKLFQEGVEYAQGWNFGPYDHEAKPVSWIVAQLTKQWGDDASYRIDGAIQPHEATYLKLDSSKAINKLGWKPRWGLNRALQETMLWYQAYQANKDMCSISINQINTFLENE